MLMRQLTRILCVIVGGKDLAMLSYTILKVYIIYIYMYKLTRICDINNAQSMCWVKLIKLNKVFTGTGITFVTTKKVNKIC